MAVTLSVKNVPDELVERLRERARRHHRSLQGELMAILEEALSSKCLTVDEVYRKIHALDIKTEDETVDLLRENRDAR